MRGLENIHEHVRDSLISSKCSIVRHKGQTIIRLLSSLYENLDDDEIYKLAGEVFTKEKLEKFGWEGVYRTAEYCEIEIPPVLMEGHNNQKNNPHYYKPDELIMKIINLNTIKNDNLG